MARGRNEKHQPLRIALSSRADLLQPSVQLEINLVLPAEIAGLSPTEVICRGEIVRTVTEQMPPSLAAKILQYHFQHGSQLPQA
jgi:hypothetical protein